MDSILNLLIHSDYVFIGLLKSFTFNTIINILAFKSVIWLYFLFSLIFLSVSPFLPSCKLLNILFSFFFFNMTYSWLCSEDYTQFKESLSQVMSFPTILPSLLLGVGRGATLYYHLLNLWQWREWSTRFLLTVSTIPVSVEKGRMLASTVLVQGRKGWKDHTLSTEISIQSAFFQSPDGCFRFFSQGFNCI